MYKRLIFDYDMLNFLERRSDRISHILLNGMSGLINEEGNFIKREEGEIDVVSYLPHKKYSIIREDNRKDPFGGGIGRQKIKIGRFIRKFISKSGFSEMEITDSDVEKFVNGYKSYFNWDPTKLKIVEGDDIKKYYLEDNYFMPDGNRWGSLWNSCMRQKERNKFMNLYVLNDVKMLVLFSDDGNVRARALLWEGIKEFNTDNTYKLMDRIYTVYDHDVNIFKKWAYENGYITKLEQSAKSELYVDVNGQSEIKHLYINLEKHNLSWYPYLDTFKYYNIFEGRFSNSQNFSYQYTLIQSSGLVEREVESDEDLDEGEDW
jgi:hypothetical protein